MQTLYTISQAAEILGKSPTATRRLADTMAEVLPDYIPITGKARQFTDNDIRTLLALSSRLSANPALTQSALIAELSESRSEPLIIPDALPSATPQEAQESPEPTTAIAEALHPAQNVIAPFLQTQENIERQMAELTTAIAEIQSQPAPAPPTVTPLVMASLVSVGVIFVSIVASALIWPMAGLVGLAIVGAVLVIGLVAPSMRR